MSRRALLRGAAGLTAGGDLGGSVVDTWAYGAHRHGLALRNDIDGFPHLTQDPIGSQKQFTYALVAPDPSTWLVVLDDWVDGTGRTPQDPHTFADRPGQQVRLRIVNVGSDTAFWAALGGHRMTVSHCDGFPVMQVPTDALAIGMGERVDVLVGLADGVFPLIAAAEGRKGRAVAVVRTGAGRPPEAGVQVPELEQRVLLGSGVQPAADVRMSRRASIRRHDVALDGTGPAAVREPHDDVPPDAPP